MWETDPDTCNLTSFCLIFIILFVFNNRVRSTNVYPRESHSLSLRTNLVPESTVESFPCYIKISSVFCFLFLKLRDSTVYIPFDYRQVPINQFKQNVKQDYGRVRLIPEFNRDHYLKTGTISPLLFIETFKYKVYHSHYMTSDFSEEKSTEVEFH